MAASEKVLALLLRLRTDPAAQRKTESDLEALRDLLDKTSKSTLSIDEAGAKVNTRLAELARAKAVDNIAEDAIKAARDADSWADALARVAQNLSDIGASEAEINRVADALANAQQQGSGIGAGAGAGGLGGVERLGSSASQILSGLGAGEAANSVGLITDAIGAIGAFGPVAGAVTIAGGALIAITSQIGAAWEAATKQAEDYAARQNALAQLTASGATSADYQRQIDEAQRSQQNLENNTTALQGYRDQIDSVRDTIANLVVDLTDPAIDFDPDNPNRRQQTQDLLDQARAAEQQLLAGISGTFGDAITSYDALGLSIDANKKNIDDYQVQIASLTAEMYSAGVAANDAAAAIAAIEAVRDKQVSTELAAAQEAEQLTAEQRRQRIEALRAELDAINVASQREGISAEYKAELAARTEELNTRIQVLSADIYTAADAADAQAKATKALTDAQAALKQQTQSYFDALEREGEAREKLAEAGQALQEANLKAAEQVAKTAAESEDKRNSIVEESGDRRAELERKTQEAVRKIERDYTRTKFRAIGERDALEARLAQIAREDQLDDQRRSDDEATAQLEEARQKQLRSLEKSLAQQSATQNAALLREQSTKLQSYQRAQLDLMNAENTSAAIRAQAINGRVIQETGAYQQMLFTTDYWMTAIANRFGQGLAAMYQQMANGLTQGSPAAYDLYGVTRQPVTTQTVTRTVDYRLNQYFQSAGITER